MALSLRELAEYLNNTQRGKGCVAYDPHARLPSYGYVPNLAAGIIFSVVFGLSLLAHIVQVTKSRKWWYSSLAIGAFGTSSNHLHYADWQWLRSFDRRMSGMDWTSSESPLSIQQVVVLFANLNLNHM